jgi:hypothetical protein
MRDCKGIRTVRLSRCVVCGGYSGESIEMVEVGRREELQAHLKTMIFESEKVRL